MNAKLIDARKEICKNREMAIARQQAWENVNAVTKKDGSQFANFSQNFANCKVSAPSWRQDKRQKSMNVFYYTPSGGYQSDAIDCFTFDNGHSWRERTVDEMWEVIDNEIARIGKYIQQLDIALENFYIVENFVNDIEQRLDSLKEHNTSLYYSTVTILHSIF